MRQALRRPAESEGDSYLASLSDLMVGMLFIFIIMLMAFALNLRNAQQVTEREKAAAQAKIAELEGEKTKLADAVKVLDRVQLELSDNAKLRGEMLEQIRRTLQVRHNIEVKVDPEAGVLRLGDKILFKRRIATLSDAPPDDNPGGRSGRDVVRVLGQVLADVLPCYSKAPAGTERQIACAPGARPVLEAVYVEGHTDSDAFLQNGQDGNWGLSSQRAINTYLSLVEARPDLKRLASVNDMPLFGIGGYGSERPVDDNRSDEGKAKNRRIDLRFVLATPDADRLNAMSREIRERAGIGPR